MKRVLVAFDGSDGAEAALADLTRGGFPEECEARVVSVADVWVPVVESSVPFPGEIGFDFAAAKAAAMEAIPVARQIAERGAQKLRAMFPGWKIDQSAVSDSPAWGILEKARRWQADLIVAGSHGRSRLERFFLGSVSYKIVAEAPCSVRIFRPHQREGDTALRIIAGLDGSVSSEAALEEMLARKWPAQTLFQVVTVLEPKLKAGFGLLGRHSPEANRDQTQGAASTHLSRAVAKFRERGHAAESHLLEGDGKTAFLDHADAWKADCIFLGARGLQHENRLYLGTFASAVVTRAHCTVEIVRTRHG